MTDTLESAFKARNTTVKAIAPQQTAVVLFIDDVNRELDSLEGDLRKLFAGSSERVASFLAATRPSRPTRAEIGVDNDYRGDTLGRPVLKRRPASGL